MSSYLSYLIILGFLFLIAFAISKFSSVHDKRHRRSVKAISRRKLFRLANRRHLLSFLLITPATASVFGFAYKAAGMTLSSAIISFCVVFVFLLLFHLPAFYLQADAWKTLRSIPDFDASVKNRSLEYHMGDWYYSDRDLLILVGKHSACIIYAPIIDFSKKVYYETRNLSLGHKSHPAYYTRIVIPLKDGGKSRQIVTFNNVVYDWIHSHGGRIIGVD